MKRKYLLNFLTFIITLIILLLIFEVGLRIAYPQPVLKRTHIEASPVIFEDGGNIPWKLKPNVDARHLSIFDEWNVSVKTNSLGLRDQEYTTELDSDKKKILLLGDSFTFGYGVEQKESYPNLLEELLGEGYVVINAGYASGYSPDTAYVYLKDKGLQFNPDVLLLGFFIGNDVTDLDTNEWVELDEKGLPKKIVSHKFYVDEQNRLRAKKDENVVENNPAPFIYSINVFFNYKSHAYIFIKDRLRPLYSKIMGQDTSLGDGFYGNTYNEDFELLWEKVENILLEMDILMKNQGKRFIIILIPKRDQFYEEKDDTYNFSKPNQRLISFGEEHDIPVIDLLPYFEKEENKFGLYFKKDGHWNSKGHDFAAKRIYEELKDLV